MCFNKLLPNSSFLWSHFAIHLNYHFWKGNQKVQCSFKANFHHIVASFLILYLHSLPLFTTIGCCLYFSGSTLSVKSYIRVSKNLMLVIDFFWWQCCCTGNNCSFKRSSLKSSSRLSYTLFTLHFNRLLCKLICRALITKSIFLFHFHKLWRG